jgi:ribonuclease Z
MQDPSRIYRTLKELQPHENLTFPDGTVLSGEAAVEAPIVGRKIVIMGDTCNGAMMEYLGMDADLLIHEATNAWADPSISDCSNFSTGIGIGAARVAGTVAHDSQSLFYSKYPTYESIRQYSAGHGHSTAEMAGAFAKKINAKKLVLTHFSQRYLGDNSQRSMQVMWQVEDEARVAASPGLWGRNDVIAAWDKLVLPIPIMRYRNRSMRSKREQLDDAETDRAGGGGGS